MTQFTTTESEPEHSAPDSGPPPDSETEDDSPEGPAGASTPRLGGSAPKLVVSSTWSGSANGMADEVRTALLTLHELARNLARMRGVIRSSIWFS